MVLPPSTADLISSSMLEDVSFLLKLQWSSGYIAAATPKRAANNNTLVAIAQTPTIGQRSFMARRARDDNWCLVVGAAGRRRRAHEELPLAMRRHAWLRGGGAEEVRRRTEKWLVIGAFSFRVFKVPKHLTPCEVCDVET